MADAITAADWPLTTPSLKDMEEKKTTHPKTPYQPHNNYKEEQNMRKRLIITLVALALAILSVGISVALCICLGLQKQVAGWLFLTWFVVSAGLTAMLALLAPLMYRNYLASKTNENIDGELGTPLEALGRKGRNG